VSPVQKTTGAKGRADRLWAEVVKFAGFCVMCGGNDRLQAHHIISRRYNRTRHLVDNGVPLCFTCHARYHDNPVFATSVIDQTIGRDRYEELRSLSVGICRMRESDWARIADELKAERTRLKEIFEEQDIAYAALAPPVPQGDPE